MREVHCSSSIAVGENPFTFTKQFLKQRNRILIETITLSKTTLSIEMSRVAQSNPNSRSIHTKNFFSKNQRPTPKSSLAGHSTVNKRKPSFVQLTRHHSDRGPHEIVFKPKRRKDYIVTDVVLKNEDITVALAYVVAVYTRMTNEFLFLCWRIAAALAVPKIQTLEMNSLLLALLTRHSNTKSVTSVPLLESERLSEQSQSSVATSNMYPTFTETDFTSTLSDKSLNDEEEFFINNQLKMYEI